MRHWIAVVLIAFPRIDSSTTAQAGLVPTFRYATTEGCGGILVAGLSRDRTEVLMVSANRRALGLSAKPRTFDLSRFSTSARDLVVRIDVFREPRRGEVYCTDAGGVWGPLHPAVGDSWRVLDGTVTIALYLDRPGEWSDWGTAVVVLENLELRAPDGRVVRAPREVALRARVGQAQGDERH